MSVILLFSSLAPHPYLLKGNHLNNETINKQRTRTPPPPLARKHTPFPFSMSASSSLRGFHERLSATPTGSSQLRRPGGANQRNMVSFSSSATDRLRVRRQHNRVDLSVVEVGSGLLPSSTTASRSVLRPSAPTTLTGSTLQPRTHSTRSAPSAHNLNHTTTALRQERVVDRREMNSLNSSLQRVQSSMERRLLRHRDEAQGSSELLDRAQRLTDRLAILKRKLEMCFELNDQIGVRRPGASLDRDTAMNQVMAARAMLGQGGAALPHDFGGGARSLSHLTATQRQQLEELVRSEPTRLSTHTTGSSAFNHYEGAHRRTDADGWEEYNPSDLDPSDGGYRHRDDYRDASAATSHPSETRDPYHTAAADSIVLSPHSILQQLLMDVDVDDAPPEFICPITQCVMIDPVSTSDGNVYERAAITQWFLSFQHRNRIPTSPLTNLELGDFSLTPHNELRRDIATFMSLQATVSASSSTAGGANHPRPATDMGGGSLNVAVPKNSQQVPLSECVLVEDEMISTTSNGESVVLSDTARHSAIPLPAAERSSSAGDEGTHSDDTSSGRLPPHRSRLLDEEPSRRFLSLLQARDAVAVPRHMELSQEVSASSQGTTGFNGVATEGGALCGRATSVPLREHIPHRHLFATPSSSAAATVSMRAPPEESLSSAKRDGPPIIQTTNQRPIWSSSVVPMEEPNSRFLNMLRMCEEADEGTLDLLQGRIIDGFVSGGRGAASSSASPPPLGCPVPGEQPRQRHHHPNGVGCDIPSPHNRATAASRGSRVVGGLYEHRRLVPASIFHGLPTATSVPTATTRTRTSGSVAATRHSFGSSSSRSPSAHTRAPTNLNSRRPR